MAILGSETAGTFIRMAAVPSCFGGRFLVVLLPVLRAIRAGENDTNLIICVELIDS